MPSDAFAELRLRAMAAATMYGCEAAIQESEDCPLESRQAVVGFRVMVVRRCRGCGSLTHRDTVLLTRHQLAESLARMVRSAAMALPDADA